MEQHALFRTSGKICGGYATKGTAAEASASNVRASSHHSAIDFDAPHRSNALGCGVDA